jgi:hypothetical protein
MLCPFLEPVSVGGILEYAPPIGAVAAPFVSELFKGLQELLPA